MSCVIRRPRFAVLLGVAGLSAAPAAWAEPAPPYPALLARAETAAPRLSAAAADVAQAEGLARQAAARPNPVLGLEVENFAGSRGYQGLDLAETTASLAQTLELGGKRPARIAAGRAAVAAARAAAAVARAEFAAQLANAYAEAEAAAATVDLAREQLAAAETDARAARLLVEAGREAELRTLQAEAERAAALAELDEAQAAAEAAFARLSARAGVAEVYDGVGASLLQAPVAANGADGPAATPAVLAARAEREAAAARVRAEGRKAAPDVTVSAGVRRLAGDDATALVAGLSVPLPLFDRNRGATDAARAELAGAQARQRQAEFDAAADLRAARAQAASAVARVKAATLGETSAAEAYRLARLGYDAGRLPLLELSSARRSLATARARTLGARLAQVRAAAEIARLTGRIPFGG